MTFLAIISLQSQNLANFAQLIKLRATYLYQTSSVAIGFPLSSPPIALVFFDVWDVFHFLLPYLYMGRYRCKEWKIRDKMYFPEKQILILISQESKNKPTLITFPSQALHIVRSLMRIFPTKKVPQIFVFWDASPKARDASRVRTHAHPTAILLFCCHKCHRGRKMRVQFVPLKVLFFQKQRIVFNKTTCRFQ